MSNKTKTNLFVDIVIFLGFLVASQPALTGTTIHEWFALSFAAVAITHLLLHWDWIVNITKTFFQKLIHESRLNYVLNTLLFTAMTAAMLSGIMISKSVLATFGIVLDAGQAWRGIHSLSANLSLLLVGLHFAMHWKWIVNSVQRYIIVPVTSPSQRPVIRPASPQLAVQPVRIENNK